MHTAQFFSPKNIHFVVETDYFSRITKLRIWTTDHITVMFSEWQRDVSTTTEPQSHKVSVALQFLTKKYESYVINIFRYIIS